jgi:L-seryl-tRNA(Ser) seleniumtransferase
LPAVHRLLEEAAQTDELARLPRALLRDAVRATLAAARERGGEPPTEGWVHEVGRRARFAARLSLRRVVNATGVVLHTNLGRAPLADEARDALTEAAGYSTLELDLDDGGRGSRQDHTRRLLCEVSGADDALVVVNAAAALLVTLNALAQDRETIVSRGELVEIGGSFRIPEILRRSGSVLVEVGTTNRTRIRDYELALSPRTGVLLKVHRSNFALSGFVSEATVAELIGLGRPRDIPVVHDVGSGLLLSLEPFGLRGEPLVRDAVAAGATVVFSGDKLLGGPQAGIVVGPRQAIARIAASPLARALRPDKSILAALEATLTLYRDPARALREIPVLRMLTADPTVLRKRARRLKRRIAGAALADGTSAVGGGAFPDAVLPSTLVTIPASSCDAVLDALRRHDPPVIARASEGRVVLDPRTIAEDEVGIVAEAVGAALVDVQGPTSETG